MVSVIPITAAPNQTFNCKVSVDGKNLVLHFRTRFNEVAGYWLVSLSDSKGNEYIVNMPILPAENLLEQYSYLGIGSAFIIKSSAITDVWPTANTLGTEWSLLWSDTNEYDRYEQN